MPEEVKEARNHDLLSVVNRHAKVRLADCVGTRVQILCEGPSKTNPRRLTGRTPQNKIVVFEGHPRQVGQIFDVRVAHSSGFTLYGECDGLEASLAPTPAKVADDAPSPFSYAAAAAVAG